MLQMVRAPVLFILSASILLIWSSTASAQFIRQKNNKILFSADLMDRDNEKDVTILRDNVQVIMEQNYISCNEAVIQWTKNQVVAVGNVLLKTPKSTIQADKIVYNISEQKGQIYNGVVLSGRILLQGEYIEKTGPDAYSADNAYLTSCTTCPASWSFTAKHFDAEIEGYAYIKSAWLNFVEVPSLYLPYLIVPLKNERQTGVLPPTFELSELNGFAIELPFFWAISRSQDLTLSPKYLSKRGVQLSTEYRYRLSEKSGGEWNLGTLYNDKRTHSTRWFTSYKHYFELPNDYIQRTSLLMASDTDVPEDFPQNFNYRGESALENRVSLTKNFTDFHVSLDASYYVSLLEQNIDRAKESSVHRVPEIRLNLTDRKIFKDHPLFFRFDAQYINFARQGLGYDTPLTLSDPAIPAYQPATTLGVFDPAVDKVRTGQRLDLLPYFYAPYQFFGGSLNITPYAGQRFTQYILGANNDAQNFNSSPFRTYTVTGASFTSEASAIFQGRTSTYRHAIIPEINFQTIEGLKQTDHAFFGTEDQIPYFLQTQPLQDLDLQPGGRGLQFDYEDRIIGQRLVNFGITNKLMRKTSSPFGTRYDQTALFSVYQAYDVIEAKKEDGRPWQDIRTILNVRWGIFDSLSQASYFPYHKVYNFDSRLQMQVTRNNSLWVKYTSYLNVPYEPADVPLNDRFQLITGGASMYSQYGQLSSQFEYDIATEEFKRWNLIGQLIPPGGCWFLELNFFKALDTDNIGGKVNVNFRFGN